MKLLLMFAFVNGVFSYFNYPNFDPNAKYLNGVFPGNLFGQGCKQYYVPDGQGTFTKFIDLKSLQNNKPQKGSKESLNTVICYQGDPVSMVALTRKNTDPGFGDKFIAAFLNRYDSEDDSFYSELYFKDFTSSCTTVYTPPFLSVGYPNCISLEVEDNYSNGYGRITVSVLGKFPVTMTCFNVPGGHISGMNYLALTTYDKLKKGGIFWYDCDSRPIRPGVYGKKSGIYIDVEQNQAALTGK